MMVVGNDIINDLYKAFKPSSEVKTAMAMTKDARIILAGSLLFLDFS